MRRGQGRTWAHDSAGAPVRTSEVRGVECLGLRQTRRRAKPPLIPAHSASLRAFTPVFDGLWTRVNALKAGIQAKDWVPAFAGTNGGEGYTGAHACRARGMMDLRAGGWYHGGRPMHGITTLQRMPKNVAAALAIALTLAGGVVGGFAARYVHLPLPWLLGALFTTMALSLAGAPVRLIPWGRPAGTVVVGASTGLQFTATVVAKLVTLLPLIIAAAFISTIVGAIGGLLYMRLTGIDRVTAFFATVPGGVVETTTIAPHYGGQLEPIMVAQTTRVALIVVFAPFLVISFVGGAAQNPLLAIPVVPWLPI